MKKIVYFSLRNEEIPTVDAFEKEHPEFSLERIHENLTEENMDRLEGADAICVSQVQELTAAVYDAIKNSSVKVMATRSAGYDMYDVEGLIKAGVRFCSVPSYSPSSIAEFAVTSAMAINRRLPQFVSRAKQGDYRWNPELMARRLQDKTVGIAGTGRIGFEAAKMFSALGAKVIGYDLYPNPKVEEVLSYVDDFDEFLRRSDIISLHMPATKENHHLLNKESLKLLPEGAILVNTARGALVDTEALIEALDSGHLAGAALDCYEFEGSFITKEVPVEELDAAMKKILQHEKIFYTPHIAYYTDDAIASLVGVALEGIVQILNAEDCPTEVKA
ncbi:MAG: NAD(P)-dependent oxidoreductase [Eubacteriales bacterium]|nr:NAD(P)-dependent oxidoreductase [Eubacteriales bacterium]